MLSKTDPSLFILCKKHLRIYVLVYVDDILITKNSNEFVEKLEESVGKQFSLKDLGRLYYSLGIQATYTS